MTGFDRGRHKWIKKSFFYYAINCDQKILSVHESNNKEKKKKPKQKNKTQKHM
jgi:hypothetical protein